MHVHWWLVSLAFLLGMVLTVALMVRPVAQRVPASVVRPVAKRAPAPPKPPRAPQTAPATRPNKKVVAKEPTKVPAKRVPPGKKLPAKKAVPAKKAPASKDGVTKRLPVGREAPTTRIPGSKDRVPHKVRKRKEARTTKIPTAPFAPYGPGSARAEPDGSGPPGWLVKGRSDTRLYYTPNDPTYERVIAQVWFTDEESAARAFFTPWCKSARRKRGSISGSGGSG